MPQTLKSSRWPKILLRTTVVVALLAGAAWGAKLVWKQVSPGLFGTKRQDKMRTEKVRTATISEEIIAVGRLRAVFSTELRSEVNGRISKILATDGQQLARGDEILMLDQQDLLTQIQEFERTIEAAKLRAQRARRDYDRFVELQKRGVVTLKDFDDARINHSLAENDARIAESRVANLRDKLTKTVIRAPHPGTLLLRDLTEGQVITGAAAQNGGTLLGEVADLALLMVRTNINEIDVARLKVADVARIRVDAMRSVTMAGAIKRIATSANESGGVDRTRTFAVDVIVEEADQRLRPGMSATIFFTLSRAENVPAVPLSAVFTTADSSRYVFLKKAEKFLAHAVDIGIADTRRVQVLGGLALGDEVAMSRPLEFEGEIPSAAPPPPPKLRGGKTEAMAAPAPPVSKPKSGKPSRT